MSKHHANAVWEGNLLQGNGKFTLSTSGYSGSVTFPSRFENNKDHSSPEELIAAAHSTCFSMALAHGLDQAGHKPQSIETHAEVTLDKTPEGFSISEILLKTKCKVEQINEEEFQKIAGESKENCPVSRALKGVKIHLQAELT